MGVQSIQSSTMVRGVSLNFLFFVGFGIGAIAIGQLLPDRIGSGRDLPGPPPPERFGTQRQRRPEQRPRRPPPDLSFDVANQRPELTIEGNSILSRAYGGTWFRSNFQDLFSYRGAQKLEWFEVLEGNDCSTVPATVNAGRPPRDICNEAVVEERRCICINTGRNVDSKTGHELMCGNCRDPCQLKFTPDSVPRYLQRLAAQGVENDFEDY